MRFINQHSFLLFGAMLLLVLGILIVRSGVSVSRVVIFAGLLLVLAITYIMLKPEALKSQDTARLGDKIGAGNPVLLEFLSPF